MSLLIGTWAVAAGLSGPAVTSPRAQHLAAMQKVQATIAEHEAELRVLQAERAQLQAMHDLMEAAERAARDKREAAKKAAGPKL